jgi:hypothetical protein
VRGVEELGASAVFDQAAREMAAAGATDAVVGGAKFGATKMEEALDNEMRSSAGS